MGLFNVSKVAIFPYLNDVMNVRVLHQGGGTLPGYFTLNEAVLDEIFGLFVSLPNFV